MRWCAVLVVRNGQGFVCSDLGVMHLQELVSVGVGCLVVIQLQFPHCACCGPWVALLPSHQTCKFNNQTHARTLLLRAPPPAFKLNKLNSCTHTLACSFPIQGTKRSSSKAYRHTSIATQGGHMQVGCCTRNMLQSHSFRFCCTLFAAPLA